MEDWNKWNITFIWRNGPRIVISNSPGTMKKSTRHDDARSRQAHNAISANKQTLPSNTPNCWHATWTHPSPRLSHLRLPYTWSLAPAQRQRSVPPRASYATGVTGRDDRACLRCPFLFASHVFAKRLFHSKTLKSVRSVFTEDRTRRDSAKFVFSEIVNGVSNTNTSEIR